MGKMLSKLIRPSPSRSTPHPTAFTMKFQGKTLPNAANEKPGLQPPAPSPGKKEEQASQVSISKSPKPSQVSEDVGLANGELSQSRRQMLDLVNRLQTTG